MKRNKRNIKKGDIYFISQDENNSPTGNEMWANRPGVVVSNNLNNTHSNVVEVVYLTTNLKKLNIPTHVHIKNKNGQSVALCEQIHSIDKSRVKSYLDKVTYNELKQINKAIALSLNIENDVDHLHDKINKLKKQKNYYKSLYHSLDDFKATRNKTHQNA